MFCYVCSKITSFLPTEGGFSEKLGIFSKVKFFQNHSCPILEKINENYDYHDALKIYGAPKLCTVMYRSSYVVKWPIFRLQSKVPSLLQRGSAKSSLAPSNLSSLWLSPGLSWVSAFNQNSDSCWDSEYRRQLIFSFWPSDNNTWTDSTLKTRLDCRRSQFFLARHHFWSTKLRKTWRWLV